jgi:hypothetical protein
VATFWVMPTLVLGFNKIQVVVVKLVAKKVGFCPVLKSSFGHKK